MDLQAYIDEIKFKLTGGVLNLELSNEAITHCINAALREVQRYIDTTKLITIDYKPCMDLAPYKVSSVLRVFRADNYLNPTATGDGTEDKIYAEADPMWMAQWQMMSGIGNIYNLSDWVLNYAAWNTASQLRNTMSTDLQFRFDKHTNFLYVSCAFSGPVKLTVEYVPVYQDVSEIKSDYWIDMVMNLALAIAKVTIGRIRTKFSQSNALWSLDANILEEGQAELAALREQMKADNQLCLPID